MRHLALLLCVLILVGCVSPAGTPEQTPTPSHLFSREAAIHLVVDRLGPGANILYRAFDATLERDRVWVVTCELADLPGVGHWEVYETGHALPVDEPARYLERRSTTWGAGE